MTEYGRYETLSALGKHKEYVDGELAKEKTQDLDTFDLTPLFYSDVNHNITGLPKKLGILNEKTNNVSGIVSDRYRLYNHDSVFNNVIDSFERVRITDVLYNFENDHDIVRMEGIFPEYKIHDDTKEGFIPGFRIMNANTGKDSVSFQFFGIRLVCLNGMTAKNIIPECTFNVRHIMSPDKLDKTIVDFVDSILMNMTHLYDTINESKKREITFENYDATVEYLTPIMTGKKPAKHIALDVHESIKVYDLYNMITYYATHNIDNHMKRDKIYNNAEMLLINTEN